MKCPKCRKTMGRFNYRNVWYWECQCGANIGKPVEMMKEEAEHETDTAQQDDLCEHRTDHIL